MNFASTLMSRSAQRHRRGRERATAPRRKRCCRSIWTGLTPAPFEPHAYATACSTICAAARRGPGNAAQLRVKAPGLLHLHRRLLGVSAGMRFTRRDFVRGGVGAFSLGFAAPRFLSDIALAQGAAFRNLVVLYLGGGNDSLSMLVPYRDPFYQSRRPDAGGARRSGAANRPRPRGQRARPPPASDRAEDDFQRRPARADSAHGLRELEPLALRRHRHLVDREPAVDARSGMARAIPRHDSCAGRSAVRAGTPAPKCRTRCLSRLVGVPSISNPAAYAFPESEWHGRGRSGAGRGDAHVVASAAAPSAPCVRQRQRSVGVRDARSRGDGRRLRSGGDVSGKRIRAGAARGRGGAGDANRHARVLGADGRIRHARGSERLLRER